MTRPGRQPFLWRDRKVLITGGSSGIGKQVAIDLLKLGAHVGIISHDEPRLRSAAVELALISPRSWSFVCDVASLSDIRRMAQVYREQVGSPEVLINNAGYAVYHTFEQLAPEEIRRLFDVNLTGAALVTREFLPDMIQAGTGDVVMVASIAGRIPITPCGVYSASKQGMISLAELLQIETARFNVHVHVVCPGRVETDFFAHESFRRRGHRPETALTIPVKTVAREIVNSVALNRRLTYVPRSFGLLVWLAHAIPLAFRPLWRRLMTSRVEALYRDASGVADPNSP